MWEVAVIAIVFAVLGLVVLWAASRGRSRREADTRTTARRGAVNLLLLVTYVGFGIVLPGVFLVGNADHASAKIAGMKLTAAEKTGRELFGEHCAVCHVLSEASGVGKVGPNLDAIRPSYSLVMRTIQNGCVQNAPSGSPEGCLGYGTMPADVVQGRQAEEVAAFVSKVAGRG